MLPQSKHRLRIRHHHPHPGHLLFPPSSSPYDEGERRRRFPLDPLEEEGSNVDEEQYFMDLAGNVRKGPAFPKSTMHHHHYYQQQQQQYRHHRQHQHHRHHQRVSGGGGGGGCHCAPVFEKIGKKLDRDKR